MEQPQVSNSTSITEPLCATLLYSISCHNLCSTSGPDDYDAVTRTLTFRPGTPSQTVLLSLNNDDSVEGQEQFMVDLSINSATFPGVTLDPVAATVDIIDISGSE